MTYRDLEFEVGDGATLHSFLQSPEFFTTIDREISPTAPPAFGVLWAFSAPREA